MALTIARRHPIIVGEREPGNNPRELGSFVVFSCADRCGYRRLHLRKLGSFVVFSAVDTSESWVRSSCFSGPAITDGFAGCTS